MNNKILKISIILIIVLSMTMSNFIFVGSSLISYATSDTATNHKNVEFKAYFKDKEGRETTIIEKETQKEETFLYLRAEVKKEGYFTGEITLENSNFNLKSSDSPYINRIENNTIILNQINVGISEEIKVKIEPIEEENYMIGLLNMTSKISMRGTYRDSTQRDIDIQANREVTLKLIENNTIDNVINEVKVITNKIIPIDGQDKRVLQIAYNVGLKENNYPIQEIQTTIDMQNNNKEQAEVSGIEYLNNMKTVEYKYNSNQTNIIMKNEVDAEGKANKKTEGYENIILTYIYNAEEQLENKKINATAQISLYNGKQLQAQSEITVETEEVDTTLEISAKNEEETMYKGKIKAGIEREYKANTEVKVNFAKGNNVIEMTEENDSIIPVIYKNTIIKKEQFDKILGANGTLAIYDQQGNVIEIITSETKADEQGNITIDYKDKNVTKIEVQATKPVEEGMLEFHHTKVIKANKGQNADEIKTTVTVNNMQKETIIKLEETTTNAELEVNKETLSTVIKNNVEIKAVLTSNDEKYDLYKNPEVEIELPEEVQNIEINSVNLLYEDELAIKNYTTNGRKINLSLEGEQTNYKEETVEGATIVMNTTLDVNRKAATQEQEIKMTYKNRETKNTTTPIKIVAPTDITTIYNMQELGIETVGQEENRTVLIQRGVEEKQFNANIEIINNNEDTVENIRILGEFPTNSETNNIGIEILQGITLQGAQNAKIYYTEKEQANDDLNNAENAWSETIENASKVRKYLIVLDKLESGNAIQGNYIYKLPANLDYNQTARTRYEVKYTNSTTKVENKLNSTNIEIRNRNWTTSRS